ncbi:hypothetical protein [Mucilaginibacter endophyticus]|uniref:hypothetical protein n=1 Tax=Mucilaginibacter endophyticus TaxID=2675003 RepID=UPI000E0CBF5E|nr:hypothetical protein [Mucilaginibacter endophyticus]
MAKIVNKVITNEMIIFFDGMVMRIDGSAVYLIIKTATLSLVALLFILLSCNHTSSKNNIQQNAKPLQDNNIDYSSIKGSRGDDLLQDIYVDQATKQPELQNLENMINHFNNGSQDSLSNFQTYDNKTLSYYRSANKALNHMQDTVLRDRLRALINESNHKYLDTIKRFSVLMAHIDSNKIKIEDYHTVLKIAVTLPIIESYQLNNIPDIKSVANLANEAQRLKAKTIQLTNKHLPKTNQ